MTNGLKHLKAVFGGHHGPFRALGLGLLLASFPLSPSGVALGSALADSGIPLFTEAGTNQDSSRSAEFEPPSPERMEALAELVSPSLSSYFVSATRRLNNRPVLELIHITVAYDFALLATEIDPENVVAWRLLLEISNISDPDDPEVKASIERSLSAITRLDPSDKVTLLRRLLFIVELNQTAEDKVSAFETLLEPRSLEVLGNKIGARLAYALAQLQSRIGDSDQYAIRLQQAVQLDPYYPAATAAAAGHFAMRGVLDAFSEAELMVAALIANPLDVGFASRLGALALDAGAYGSAARMLAIAQSSARAAGSEPLDIALQHATALWGANRSEEAERILDLQQRAIDEQAQRVAFAEDDTLQADELTKIKGTTPPLMALLRAAILSEGTDEQAYRLYVGEALTDLILMLDEELELDLDLDPAAQASALTTLLEAAAFAAWQGEDSAVIDLLVTEAQARFELSAATTMRFEVWQDIAEGRYSVALVTLSEMNDSEELTVLARSIAYERTGRMQDAARTWLELSRTSPGSIIGIWARHKLEKLLGKQLGNSPEAGKIEDLMKGIPITVDRMLLDRDRAYSFNIEPVASSVPPFAPINYILKITNNSGIPLSVGPLNPINSSIALLPKVTSFGPRTAPSSLYVLQIDRKLSINPRETLEVRFDLANFPISERSLRSAFNSATYEIRGVTNFFSDGTAVLPGRFGERASAAILRVDGVSNDPPWRRDAMESARSMDSLDSIHKMSLLLQMASQIPDENDSLRPLRDEIVELFSSFWPHFPPKLRAWFAATSPEVAVFDDYTDIESLFVLDDNPLVVASMLVKLVYGTSSEVSAKSYLDWAANNSINSEVSRLAKQLLELTLNDLQLQSESLLGDELDK